MALGSSYSAEIIDANGHITEGATIQFADSVSQPLSPGAGPVWVTDAAAPPTTFVTPLVFDHTASTGGLYAWTGSAYIKVGLATT